jgi:tRNA threonylcarbamoyladenosine biosynthesis protein TsaE
MINEYISHSEQDTLQLAREIKKKLKPGIVIGLSGPLGAGKTTLVKHILNELGYKQEVSSPTFVLQHVYSGEGDFTVEHWDLYRLNAPPIELLEFQQNNNIIIIEWAEKFPEVLEIIDIRIDIILQSNDNSRTFIVQYY